ncbi:hypothetical protein Pmani_015630 [Petrolisthes manimaculis]|uniref:C2H2-type domain-containing protein n=1 Tax=Petrolisthes manimaculis TaxID=1843537 RepID=A0AAE1UBV2_9EUCA|nr:hypothetical protein Pmani_015630 [Petrolisthes manimaculis]
MDPLQKRHPKPRALSTIQAEADSKNPMGEQHHQCCGFKPSLSNKRRGHVQRMEPFRLPKIMLYGELANGTRPRGAPKLLYKDHLKRTLALTNIDPSSWEQTARDCATWRRAVHHGTTAFEEKKKDNEEAKRRRRERQEQPRPPPTLPCKLCPQLFHHRLGLSSHIRHKHPP